MTWVFKRYDRNSSDGYALKAVRFPSSDASPNGIQIIAHVLAMSKFTIGTPSRKLEGLYYCEWTTKTFVHRSPAIDLRLTDENPCVKPVLWRKLCHQEAVCVYKNFMLGCKCKRGFIGDGKVCTELNECRAKTFRCPSDTVCINTHGSYRCKCFDGRQYNSKSRRCEGGSSSSTDANNHRSSIHQSAQSAVSNQKAQSAVSNQKTQSAVRNQKAQSAVSNQKTQSAVSNQKAQSAVSNQKTHEKLDQMAANNETASSSKGGSSSAGLIAGVITGIGVVGAAVGTTVYCLVRRPRARVVLKELLCRVVQSLKTIVNKKKQSNDKKQTAEPKRKKKKKRRPGALHKPHDVKATRDEKRLLRNDVDDDSKQRPLVEDNA
ncbi:uncharacterized protein LOC134191443 [Corticium candelabrum]|uniref:uncharacterized protein LOC134191443 n=1 Tax=Corticium candelabrum TaxID=121492 RepID=UPI002E25F795|nr:uncharacterized protein LOC134191443 [Corticium candelabrum]